jgi:hypothetical protein
VIELRIGERRASSRPGSPPSRDAEEAANVGARGKGAGRGNGASTPERSGFSPAGKAEDHVRA